MLLKKTTLLASAGLILASSIAMANINNKIDDLPNDGQIAIVGKVDSIESKRDFTIQDEIGKKISVQSPSEIKFEKGDNVEIHGHIGEDIMGKNKGITAFKVKVQEEEQTKEKTSLKLNIQ